MKWIKGLLVKKARSVSKHGGRQHWEYSRENGKERRLRRMQWRDCGNESHQTRLFPWVARNLTTRARETGNTYRRYPEDSLWRSWERISTAWWDDRRREHRGRGTSARELLRATRLQSFRRPKLTSSCTWGIGLLFYEQYKEHKRTGHVVSNATFLNDFQYSIEAIFHHLLFQYCYYCRFFSSRIWLIICTTCFLLSINSYEFD